MSLFSSLPAPSNKRSLASPLNQEEDLLKKPRSEGAEKSSGFDGASGESSLPPVARTDAASGSTALDPVTAAIRKIASHISHPKKFTKASELLRQLFGQDALKQEHGPLVFSALKAAMQDPQQAHQPMLAREYSKLFTAASKHAEIFTLKERSQLDVYGTWAVLRNQLTTDDSFQFNKVVGRLKAMAEDLPEASEEDDAVLQRLQETAGAPDPVLTAAHSQQPTARDAGPTAAADAAAEGGGGAAAGAAGVGDALDVGAGPGAGVAGQQGQPVGGSGGEVGQESASGSSRAGGAAASPPPPPPPPAPAAAEHDPFGLDALLDTAPPAATTDPPPPPPPPAPQPPPRPKSVVWSSAEMRAMRREALLDCVDTCRGCYRHAWARTSVDLLVEHLHRLVTRFAPCQRTRVEESMRFVRDQRRLRKMGPSAKEVARDVTSFDMARAEWSKQAVSARGKIGSGGDHKSEMWLG